MELQRVGLDLVSEQQQQLTFNNSKKGETNSNKIYYLDKYIQSIINMKTNKKMIYLTYFLILELSSLKHVSFLKHIPHQPGLFQAFNGKLGVITSKIMQLNTRKMNNPVKNGQNY